MGWKTHQIFPWPQNALVKCFITCKLITMVAYFCSLHAINIISTSNVIMLICDLFMSTCNKIISTCKIILLSCDLNYVAGQHIYLACLHKYVACEHRLVTLDLLHLTIIFLNFCAFGSWYHVDKIYLTRSCSTMPLGTPTQQNFLKKS